MQHRSLALLLALSTASAAVTGGSGQAVTRATVTTRPFQVRAPDGWTFKGELTLPPGARTGQKYPTVLLVHGSGIGDMNETVPEEYARVPGGSANFLLLAQRLNAAGFAVVRFNKRGALDLGPRTLPPEKMVGAAYTPTGITRDAMTILQYASRQPGVDPSRLFLLGTSEGTDIVSKMATEHPGLIHGVVMIGVSGDSGKETLRLQIVQNQVNYAHTFDQNRDGLLTEAEINEVPEKLRVWLQLWEAMGVLSSKTKQYRFTTAIDGQGQRGVNINGAFAQFLNTYFERTYPDFPFMGPNWGTYMRDADQFGYTATLIPGYAGPVLMMNGDKDDQTPLSGALKSFDAAKKSGNRDVTLRVYPGTGHTLAPLYQGATTLGPMNEQSLQDLTSWLKAQAR